MPKCNNKMTTALYLAFGSTLEAARVVQPFTNGDVMSAALYVLIDAGMRAVENGTCTRAVLIKDICDAIPGAVNEWRPAGEAEASRTLQ